MHQLTLGWKSTLAVCAALFAATLSPSVAHGQTWYDQKPGLKITMVPDDKGFLLDVWARDVSARALVENLAEQARMDIIIKDDAQIEALALRGVSPDEALHAITDAAHLSYRKIGKTYVVEKKPIKPAKSTALELKFTDMPVAELLRLLGEQFDIQVEVSPAVSGKFAVIMLNNEEATRVIETVARAADLSLVVTDKGVYRVGFEPNVKP